MTHAEIAALLADQIDVRQKSVGIVVAIVSPEGRRVIPYGLVQRGGAAPVDGRTPFDLASIGKVFTGLLFADIDTPGLTSIALRWPYIVTSPCPWSRITVLPLKK